MLSVQIGAAMKHNLSNLQAMQSAGGFAAVTQLLQWTSFTFGPLMGRSQAPSISDTPSAASHTPAAARPQPPRTQHSPSLHIQAASTQGSHDVHHSQSSSPGSPRTHQPFGSRSAPKHGRGQWPASKELGELFAVLSSWLSLAGIRHGLPLWQE